MSSSSRAPAKKVASYADVLAAPHHVVAEVIHGTLITSPRPAAPHAHVTSVLGMDLGSPFQRGRGGPGGWWILFEPELHFGAHIVVPDLAGWRLERMATIPDTAYFTPAPDWLCEVLSPSTEAIGRSDKLEIYRAAEVSWVWLANPRARILEVLQNSPEGWLRVAIHRDDAVASIPPFDAIELDVGALWLPKPEDDA